jgi:hypothetical protein
VVPHAGTQTEAPVAPVGQSVIDFSLYFPKQKRLIYQVAPPFPIQQNAIEKRASKNRGT